MRKLLALLLLLALSGAALGQMVTVFPAPQGGQALPAFGSNTGTSGSVTATLTGAASKFTYLCGFTVTSAGTTSATAVNVTVTGAGTTLNHTYACVSSGQGLMGIAFPGCLASSATNANFVVTLPACGAGSTVAITAWGYLN